MIFDRFHSTCESLPDFTSREWFDIKVLVHDDTRHSVTQEIQYDTHLQFTKESLTKVGIASKAVTHVFRASSARMAELGGASQGHILRAGRWENEGKVMLGAYLTGLPREFMRVTAGFRPEGGTYFLPRDVEVPQHLQKQIFPQADEW